MNLSFDFAIFPDEARALLPVLLQPKGDELFSSWVVRLAHANYIKAYTFTRSVLKTPSFWNRDIDRVAPERYLQTLALKTNQPFERIRELTLQGLNGRLFVNDNEFTPNNWIMPLGIYHRTWRNNGLMYCPGCLRKATGEPYFKRNWRLSLAVICPDCGIILHDHCPSCSSPVIFFRSELGKKNIEPSRYLSRCFHCNFDLTQSPGLIASPDLIQMQTCIFDILETGWRKEVIYPHHYFAVLKYWLKAFCSKSPFFHSLQQYVYHAIDLSFRKPDGGYKNRFDTKPVEERIGPLKAAFWLLECWPQRFIETIRKTGLHSSALLRDFDNAPFWYFFVVNENFHVSNINRRFLNVQ